MRRGRNPRLIVTHTRMRIEADVLAAAAVVGGVVVLCVVARTVSSGDAPRASADVARRGRELLQQAQEWYRLAEQDASPLYALRHAQYALAYANAARVVAPDEVLQAQSGGADVHALVTTLERTVAALSKKVARACPKSDAAPRRGGGAKAAAVGAWL